MTSAVVPIASVQPRILLVDDDPFMLGLQSRMLRTMNYASVRTAGSAYAALALLRSGEGGAVDVIVCDLNMPGMDGVAFLQAVNAGSLADGVILLSGEGARLMHTVQKLLSGGRLTILGALEKPSHPDALHELLEFWQRRSPIAPAPARALAITHGEIEQAVARREWVLHYQPKVSLLSGDLIGMEALMRWNHPTHGLVYPDNFIGMAEECGAIDALTEWVLLAGLDQLAGWIADGLAIQLAINVSMDNLQAPGFADRAGRVVRDAGLSPSSVTFEITESQAMSPSPAPLESLVRLRLQRFKLSIDDFGTGHSSLAQLRDVPFTELKIDRGFVHGARGNQIIRPILEGSIGIAKRLGLISVAEGVETQQDWDFLRETECDVAQGYFIGRPMHPNHLPDWIAHWRARQPNLLGA